MGTPIPAAPPAGIPPNGSAFDISNARPVLSSNTPPVPQLGFASAASGDAPMLGAAPSATSPGAIEQVVSAHQSLARVAARIATQVVECTAAEQRVLVQGTEGAGLIAGFRAFRAQAVLLERAFTGIAPDPSASVPVPGLALPAAAGVAATVAGAIKSADALVLPVKHIASLLQSRVSGLEARLVRTDEAPLVAEVARHLRAARRIVMYPRVAALELRDPMPALELIVTTLDAAQTAAQAAASRVAALAAPEKTPWAARLTPLVSALARMQKQLFELPDDSALPTDPRALIDGADRVRELDAGAVLLTVQIVGAGSSPRPATAWHWKPAYTAGAVASYFLSSGAAELIRSGTVADYASFREPGSF